MAKDKLVPAKVKTQKPESLKWQVWSDKLNSGAKYIIIEETGGQGTPGPKLYSLFSPSRSLTPRAFTVTEHVLNTYYTHRPEVDKDAMLAAGGLSTENSPI